MPYRFLKTEQLQIELRPKELYKTITQTLKSKQKRIPDGFQLMSISQKQLPHGHLSQEIWRSNPLYTKALTGNYRQCGFPPQKAIQASKGFISYTSAKIVFPVEKKTTLFYHNNPVIFTTQTEVPAKVTNVLWRTTYVMAKRQFTASGVSTSPHIKCYKKEHKVDKRNQKILGGQHSPSVHHQPCSDRGRLLAQRPFWDTLQHTEGSQSRRNSLKLFLFILPLPFSTETGDLAPKDVSYTEMLR